MNALVMFDSEYGNTEQVARAVAAGLEPVFSVRLATAEPDVLTVGAGMDLIVVGGPTHRHRMSRQLAAVMDSAPRKAWKGIKVAAFDTRYRIPVWLSGSAAVDLARRLRKLGGRLILPTQSFFVAYDVPPKGTKRRHDLERMEPGEIERAAAWAKKIAKTASGG